MLPWKIHATRIKPARHLLSRHFRIHINVLLIHPDSMFNREEADVGVLSSQSVQHIIATVHGSFGCSTQLVADNTIPFREFKQRRVYVGYRWLTVFGEEVKVDPRIYFQEDILEPLGRTGLIKEQLLFSISKPLPKAKIINTLPLKSA